MKFAALFHASPVALHVARLDTGEVIDCNDAVAELIGYSRQEIVGHSMAELGVVTIADRNALLAAQQKGHARDLPVTVTRRSGERRDCLVSGGEVEVEGQICLLVSTVDITPYRQAEQEHAYLAALIASSFDGIVSRDMNGFITGWNAAAERILGYSAEEAIGKHISFMVPDSAWSQYQANHARLQRGIAMPGGETQRRAKDGRLVDLAYNTFVVRNAGGAVLGVATIARDVSERKRVEAELRASEERYRFLTESMKDIVWSMDVEPPCITYVSPSVTRLLGWSREEYMTAPITANLTPEGARLMSEIITQAVREFDSAEQPPHPRYFDGEFEALHKNGARVWFEVIAFLRRNEKCGRLEVYGVSRDISERKHAEAALRASERRLQLAARAAGMGIWHWNLADNSYQWDERMCELYALSAAERAAGNYFAAWQAKLHPADRQWAEATLNDALRTASESECTFRIVLPDGAVRYIYAAAMIELDETGAPLRMVGVNQDITQQKAHERLLEETNAELERQVAARTTDLRATVEELRRADAGKDAFLAAVSHELRTPLVGVLGMAELLGAEVRGPLNPEQAKYVATIEDSGRRLLSLVNNLLLYTHLMSGGEAITRETYCLADLCAAAVNAIRPQAERKQHHITQHINPFDLSIKSNAEGIINMLKMLLDNAVKFTPAGGRIEVTIWEASAEDMVHIDVADNGIGMTPAEIAGLFRPLSQVDNSLSRRYEGVGIGLAFVRKMVELLGGVIAVESQPGLGSRFSIALPRE